MKNTIKAFVLVLVAMIAITAYAAAVNLNVEYVKINGEEVSIADGHARNLQVERGEDLDVKVCVQALADVKDVQIEADIYGYRYSSYESTKISDETSTFDLAGNDTTCKTLKLEVPEKMDKDYYKLRILVGDRDSTAFSQDYELHVTGIARDSAVIIKDYSFNPEEVIAGRAFTAIVKVKNMGSDDLEDLKITLSIPELGIKTSEFMTELDADESKTFEELLLRVPECAKAGTYDVTIKVEFDEYETTVTEGTIDVVSSNTCGSTLPAGSDKTVITVPSSQEVAQGTGVVYPIMIGNSANVAKTYTISVSGASAWATTRIDPSAVIVVPAGQAKTVYLYVSANSDAELGDKAFTINVETGSEAKQIPVTAKITKAAGANWDNVKNGLQIGLVVLVIILLVIGLIIGYNKMKENKNEPETYY